MATPSTPATEATSAQPERRRSRERLREFWIRVTEGLEIQQLWNQFKAEAGESYVLYSREVDWKEIEQEKRWKRPFRIASALFMVMLMKLTPARRVLLLIACVLLLIQADFRIGDTDVSIRSGAVGALLLFVLLALELADRVTMKRDLEIAREIQHWLVPEKPPQVPGWDIAFASRPANTVAGDYYDTFFRPAPLNDAGGQRLMLVVADVAGKSVPAALLMATFQASLQTLAASPVPLPELVRVLNRYACAHSLGGQRFTTAFLGELNPATQEMTYINAGHNSPILRRADGKIESLDAGGLPLGISLQAGVDGHYDPGFVRFGAGDLIVIYTDGLVEGFNKSGEEYGQRRLLLRIGALSSESAAGTLAKLMADVDTFVGSVRQHDDITCVVVKAQ